MFELHPIYALAIALVIVILVVIESLNRGVLLKFFMTFSFLNLAVWVVLLFFYDLIIDSQPWDTIYMAFSMVTHIVFFVLLFLLIFGNKYKYDHHAAFIKAIRNSRWNVYYSTDVKDRINDISPSFLEELGLSKEEVLGKKFADVINSTIRVTSHNHTPMNNADLVDFYQRYALNAHDGAVLSEEISFMNADGILTNIKMITQPIFNKTKYAGRISIGEKKSDMQLLELEKVLQKSDTKLDVFKRKFTDLVELSNEGIIFTDKDSDSIWLNDVLTQELGLTKNEFHIHEFYELINKEDLARYEYITSHLNDNNPSYSASYRITINGKEHWLKERGKMSFAKNDSGSITAVVSVLSGKLFSQTNIQALDSILDETNLMADVKTLARSRKDFVLAIIRLINVPQINDQYGRQLGNMAIANYVGKISKQYASGDANIYRLSGLDFALTITDTRRMADLVKASKEDPKMINDNVMFGGISFTLEVKMGVATMYHDADDPLVLIKKAYEALQAAINPANNVAIAYYKDVI